MSPTFIGITGIIIMILMFLTRMPVAFVMASVGFVGFSCVISPDAGLVLLSRNVYETFDSYSLTTIPLYPNAASFSFALSASADDVKPRARTRYQVPFPATSALIL